MVRQLAVNQPKISVMDMCAGSIPVSPANLNNNGLLHNGSASDFDSECGGSIPPKPTIFDNYFMETNELEEGTWLVVIDGNSTSCHKIKPDFPELEAALFYLKEAMVKEMCKICQLRPQKVLISKKEQKAWAKYKEIMGKDIPLYFEFTSLYEIAESGCNFIREKIIKKKQSKSKRSKTYKDLKIESLEVINNSISQLDI
jgi:hypothetical protein